MRFAAAVAVLAVAAFVVVQFAAGGWEARPAAAALAGPAASLADFMLFVHNPKSGLPTQMRDALAGGGPADDKAWRTQSARAAVLVHLAETILKPSTPEKGDKASWRARVNEYVQTTKAIAKASEAKDAEAMSAEVGKLTKGCESCHKAHR